MLWPEVLLVLPPLASRTENQSALVSQCPDTQTQDNHSASAELKMKSVLVGFLLALMIGDIVGPGRVSYYDEKNLKFEKGTMLKGNGGGDDNDKEPPLNIIMRNRLGNNGGGADDDKEPPHRRSADEEVHFIKDIGVQRRQGRQSLGGCMMGCTRELRVRT